MTCAAQERGGEYDQRENVCLCWDADPFTAYDRIDCNGPTKWYALS